jgi:hypothetical protein
VKAPYSFVPKGNKFLQLDRGYPTGKTYASFEAARTETLRLNDAWRAEGGKRKNPKNEGRPTDAEIREFAAVLYRNSPLDPSNYPGSSRRLLDQWFDALYGTPSGSAGRNRSDWVKQFIPEYKKEDLDKLAKVLHDYQNDPYNVPPTKRRLYPEAEKAAEEAELVSKMSMFANPGYRHNYAGAATTNYLRGLRPGQVERLVREGSLDITYSDIGNGYHTVTLFEQGQGENYRQVEAKWFVEGDDAWYDLSLGLRNGKVDPSTADLFLGPSRWDKREREEQTRVAAKRKGINIAETYHYFNNPKARRSR